MIQISPFQVGVEGTGFEPTIEALFGENGFFPDAISKAVYWAGEKAETLRETLDKFAPEKDRMKREVKTSQICCLMWKCDASSTFI